MLTEQMINYTKNRQQEIYLNLEIFKFFVLQKTKRKWPCHLLKQVKYMVLSLNNSISNIHLNMTN